MLFPTKRLPVLAFIIGTVLGLPAMAQDDPDLNTVVATVDGTDITLGHMLAFRARLPQQYSQFPPETLFTFVRDDLIRQTVLMQAQEGEGSQRSKLMIENETRAVIAGEMLQGVLDKEFTEEELKTAYDEKYADQETEYNAAHILVKSEEEAKDIIAKLDKGEDFAKLAKEFSIGPSGENGGELHWFGPGVMVADFFDAVTGLEPGTVSEPVQTEFGWHVIKLNETRIAETPAFEDVRAELEQELRNAAVTGYIDDLEAEAEIENPDISGIDPSVINKLDLLEN